MKRGFRKTCRTREPVGRLELGTVSGFFCPNLGRRQRAATRFDTRASARSAFSEPRVIGLACVARAVKTQGKGPNGERERKL